MSPRRWILLLIFYISYLMFGASIYYHIEHGLEKERRALNLRQRIEINEYLIDQLDNKNQSIQNDVLEKITDYCGKPVTNYTRDEYEDPYIWTFYHAFFFSFTVLSTVGYGNLAPSTTLGRMIMIAYSLIGIPINGILFTGIGDYFSKTFTSIYRKYKKYKMTNDIRYVPPKLSLFATVCIALVPGITFFIILPSLIFSYFENWPFVTSVYYSYVTMTTIGFGDFVPTFQPQQPREFGGLFVVYQIFIIVWFIFSLGYLVMIMTFISKGLRSKKLANLEYQLSENIKATQMRIWNGVTKDVGYLRRILNELYIMKFQPVYNEPLQYKEKRSISCPDLTIYRLDLPVISRKRAFSECCNELDAQVNITSPMRAISDTELSNIDKKKTFESAENFKHTTELLAKVVTALAHIKPSDEQLTLTSSGLQGGYQGFTDSQILASEWSYPPSVMDNLPQRGRAFSDFNLNPRTALPPRPNEWTWSGDNNQIQQAINIRCKTGRVNDRYYNPPFSGISSHPGIVVDIERNEGDTNRRRKFSVAESGKQLLRKLVPFRKRSSQGLLEKSDPSNRKSSAPCDEYHYNTFTQNSASNVPNTESDLRYLKNRRSTMFDITSKQDSYTQNSFLPFQSAAAGVRKRDENAFPQSTSTHRSTMLPGNRRNSLFTDQTFCSKTRSDTVRRLSVFSEADVDHVNDDILENTTIADIIRAIEVMHTQAVLCPTTEEFAFGKKENNIGKKTRKLGTAGIVSSGPSAGAQQLNFNNATSTNRLFSRRSTIVGPNLIGTSAFRRPSTTQLDPGTLPAYSEKQTPQFKRRFSVRPTNLQIPPGKAPPPTQIPTISASISSNQSTSQTALQRKLSLRPSPLAGDSSRNNQSSTSKTTFPASRTSALPSSSSTHSPLSRIVQISQAQRKNSEQKDPSP